MMKQKLAALGGGLAMLVLLGAGCVGSKQPSAPVVENTPVNQPAAEETGPITIGWLGPLSGDAAVYGEPGKKVVELAVEQINSAGGINGRQLQVVYEDGKCNGKDAANAMQKLVNVDKVQVVIGGFCSSESLAAAPIANANRVLLFSPASSSPELTTKGGQYFMRDYPSDATQGKVLAEVAYNKKGWKKVAIAQELTDYAQGVRNAFSENFEKLGGTVVVEEFDSKVTDFRTTITKLKAGKPDALLVSVQTPKVAELVLKQVKQLSWSVPLLGADIIPGSDLPKTKADLLEGMIVAEFGYDAASQKFKDFMAAYKSKYGVDPEYLSYSQTEYDAPMILATAMKAVGTDPGKIREWLGSVKDWQGVSGMVSFDEHGDRTVGHKPEVINGGQVLPLE